MVRESEFRIGFRFVTNLFRYRGLIKAFFVFLKSVGLILILLVGKFGVILIFLILFKFVLFNIIFYF